MFTDEETQSKVIIKLAQGILGGEFKGVHSGRFLAGLGIDITIAWVTINRKINKKPNTIQEETSETQF